MNIEKKITQKPASKSSSVKRPVKKRVNKFESALNETKLQLLESQKVLQQHNRVKEQLQAQLNQVETLVQRESASIVALSNLLGKLNKISQD